MCRPLAASWSTRLSRSSISDELRPASPAVMLGWPLLQMLWVGGLWALQFMLLPALEQYQLAPMLVHGLVDYLRQLVVGVALVASLLQAVLLVRVHRFNSLWRELRGQLLLACVLLAAVYLAVAALGMAAERWLTFNYTVLALLGLMLVMQPVPGFIQRNA